MLLSWWPNIVEIKCFYTWNTENGAKHGNSVVAHGRQNFTFLSQTDSALKILSTIRVPNSVKIGKTFCPLALKRKFRYCESRSIWLIIEGARDHRLLWLWCDQSITDTHTDIKWFIVAYVKYHVAFMDWTDKIMLMLVTVFIVRAAVMEEYIRSFKSRGEWIDATYVVFESDDLSTYDWDGINVVTVTDVRKLLVLVVCWCRVMSGQCELTAADYQCHWLLCDWWCRRLKHTTRSTLWRAYTHSNNADDDARNTHYYQLKVAIINKKTGRPYCTSLLPAYCVLHFPDLRKSQDRRPCRLGWTSCSRLPVATLMLVQSVYFSYGLVGRV